MKLLSSTSICYIFLMGILATFRVPNDFSIKEYTIANTNINIIKLKNAHMIIRRFFNVNIASETYTVLIQPNSLTYLYDESSEVVLFSRNLSLRRNISEYSSYIVNGYILGFSTSTSVEGYIQNGKYYGTIVFENKKYYVANINRFPKIAVLYRNKVELNAIIYEQYSLIHKNQTNLFKRPVRLFNQRNAGMGFKEFIAERHICSLYLLLDHSFLTIIHNKDVTAAVAQVMLSVREVNSIFRSTDFDEDGIPDNIGFIIKYLVILESDESPYNYMPPYSAQPVSPKDYLAHFAQYAILGEVCLGVLFTAQSFEGNVLGVSYSAVSESDLSHNIIGGICQRPFARTMLSLNAAAVSYISTKGVQLKQNTLDTCLAHELGHAFGCRHDIVSDPGYDKDYLMSSYTLPGTSDHNFQFSPNSKKHLVMTVPKKGQCLVKSTKPFCGNGILENGEECDCGAKYMCKLKDPCCIASDKFAACQVDRTSGFQCHPSQGLCCNSKCRYEHLEKIGVDCKQMDQKCPCNHNLEDCRCGLGGKCFGWKCQSEECARIDARECDCPASPKIESCNICCRNNTDSPCLSSKNLTELKLAMGSTTIKQLMKFNILRILPYMNEFQKFCHGMECITLAFKTSNVGDYCLQWGKLGVCTGSGCNVEKVGPFMAKTMTGYLNCTARSCSIFYNIFLVYCILLLLTIK